MKAILAGVALAAAFAAPALAQTSQQYHSPYTQYSPNAPQMYIYPPDNHQHSSNPAYDVYDTRGHYVGSDPDPFIRDQLGRGHGKN